MRAATFEAVGKPLRIETVETPQPGNGEVVLEVAYCGICGSDLHMTQYQGILKQGDILGHEFTGTISALGPNVDPKWKVGDRVTSLPVIACHNCEMCDQGLFSLCTSMYVTGVGKSHGAYAQYVASPAETLFKLPAGVDFRDAALTEPLSVALHAVEMADIKSSDNVLVIGGGPIGLGVAMFAKYRGARNVVVSEFSAGRTALAKKMGATATINPATEDVSKRFKELTGSAPQVVFECVGAKGLLDQAVAFTAPRGRIVVVGVMMGEDNFTPMHAFGKEIVFKFTQCYSPTDYEVVLDLLDKKRIDPSPMVTDIIDLNSVPEKFEALRKPSTQCKILISPSA